MATKEQQRQKKLAKKRSKELAKKKAAAREKNRMQSFSGQLSSAIEGSIERCLVAEDLLNSDSKFGTVFITRRMPDGRVAAVRFLIDGFCMGVKNCNAMFCFPSQLTELLENSPETMMAITPPAARRLVEQAAAYARQFDILPHPDYDKLTAIFGDIDPNECSTDFVFGRDGQPVYIAGPGENEQRIGEIIEKLSATAGEGNYIVEYDEAFDLDDEMAGTSWTDDPELDIDIDEDLPPAT
ncbi:hypothetical protein [Rubripirellula lacrimiformis]|uniref:hypothetical protein n=1 Tax=Rubripirellula lacrimiformis TaxID=1930273 RepID=UPI0011A20F07|nr:hypothetical protein [Rubripirellula lacrimiformis]